METVRLTGSSLTQTLTSTERWQHAKARQKFGQTREHFSSPCTFAPAIVPRSHRRRSDLLHHDVWSQGIPTKNPDFSACYYVCCCWQNTDDTVPQCHEKIHPKTGRKEQNERESKVQLRKLGSDFFQLQVFALCAEGEVEEAGGWSLRGTSCSQHPGGDFQRGSSSPLRFHARWVNGPCRWVWFAKTRNEKRLQREQGQAAGARAHGMAEQNSLDRKGAAYPLQLSASRFSKITYLSSWLQYPFTPVRWWTSCKSWLCLEIPLHQDNNWF